MSKASHYSSKARHAQREFGAIKPKLQPVGTDTAWISPFMEGLGLAWFSADSAMASGLADSHEQRELMLRKASSMGLLSMKAYREDGVFIEYRWFKADQGDWWEEECLRISGEMPCPECKAPYWKHPSVALEAPTLVRACDGRLLKL